MLQLKRKDRGSAKYWKREEIMTSDRKSPAKYGKWQEKLEVQ